MGKGKKYTISELEIIGFLNSLLFRNPKELTLESCKEAFKDKDHDINIATPASGNILFIASAYRKYDVVKWLLEDKNAEVNLANSEGNTALHVACCIKDNDQVIQLLLSHGASTNYKNQDGYTAIDIAKEYQCQSQDLIAQLEKAQSKNSGNELNETTSLQDSALAGCESSMSEVTMQMNELSVE